MKSLKITTNHLIALGLSAVVLFLIYGLLNPLRFQNLTAGFNAPEPPIAESTLNTNGPNSTPLLTEIENPSQLDKFFANGGDLNERDTAGNSLLHTSSHLLLETIFTHAVNPNLKNHQEQTPLMSQILKGDKDAIMLLLNHPDIDVYAKDLEGKTAFDYAAKSPDQNIRKLFSQIDDNLEEKKRAAKEAQRQRILKAQRDTKERIRSLGNIPSIYYRGPVSVPQIDSYGRVYLEFDRGYYSTYGQYVEEITGLYGIQLKAVFSFEEARRYASIYENELEVPVLIVLRNDGGQFPYKLQVGALYDRNQLLELQRNIRAYYKSNADEKNHAAKAFYSNKPYR